MTQRIHDDDLISIAAGNNVLIRIDDGGDGGRDGGRDVVNDPPNRASGGGTGVQYDNPDGGTQDKSTGIDG